MWPTGFLPPRLWVLLLKCCSYIPCSSLTKGILHRQQNWFQTNKKKKILKIQLSCHFLHQKQMSNSLDYDRHLLKHVRLTSMEISALAGISTSKMLSFFRSILKLNGKSKSYKWELNNKSWRKMLHSSATVLRVWQIKLLGWGHGWPVTLTGWA